MEWGRITLEQVMKDNSESDFYGISPRIAPMFADLEKRMLNVEIMEEKRLKVAQETDKKIDRLTKLIESLLNRDDASQSSSSPRKRSSTTSQNQLQGDAAEEISSSTGMDLEIDNNSNHEVPNNSSTSSFGQAQVAVTARYAGGSYAIPAPKVSLSLTLSVLFENYYKHGKCLDFKTNNQENNQNRIERVLKILKKFCTTEENRFLNLPKPAPTDALYAEWSRNLATLSSQVEKRAMDQMLVWEGRTAEDMTPRHTSAYSGYITRYSVLQNDVKKAFGV